MISIDYMIEYITLAETLNYCKAAEHLYISQPVLSKHIAAIEEEIGAKLFLRNTRSVTITPAGKLVYYQFQKIIDIHNQTREQAAALSTMKARTLIISSPYYWTADYTEPIVLNFSIQHPQHNIEIISSQPSEGRNQLKTGGCDLLLTCDFGFMPENSIRRFPFSIEPMGVILHINNPLAQQKFISIRDLNQSVLVFLDSRDPYNDALNKEVLRLFSAFQVSPSRVEYAQQVDTIGLVIQRTNGVCVIPYGVRNMVRSYTTIVPLKQEDLVMQACFYYKLGNNNPLIPQFLHLAEKIFSKKS